ncbi:MAG: tRNA pseudouridine(55) synthase TruB [Firmicutes bacterium]|jgi:tRNA pseudouridine55 synthase|nr:tRNA pseudouridine(55) synthase TruB [Bacillota bacterium]
MPTGILNLLKPKDKTSHDMVAYVRKLFQGKKAGHTGTLDPSAVGVLPICLGKATRISEYLLTERKTYRAEINFGTTTDTDDAMGRIIDRKNVPPDLDFSFFQELCKKFEGELWQTPPMYSAVKYKGERLYELARKGKKVTRKPRRVKVYSLKPICYFKNTHRFIFEIECSKGTYIRTLARQIGESVGCGAHLSFLLRTKVGAFTVDKAHTCRELELLERNNKLHKSLEPMDKALEHFKPLSLPTYAVKLIKNGRWISENDLRDFLDFDIKEINRDNNFLRLYDSEQNFFAVGRVLKKGQQLLIKPEKVFI